MPFFQRKNKPINILLGRNSELLNVVHIVTITVRKEEQVEMQSKPARMRESLGWASLFRSAAGYRFQAPGMDAIRTGPSGRYESCLPPGCDELTVTWKDTRLVNRPMNRRHNCGLVLAQCFPSLS